MASACLSMREPSAEGRGKKTVTFLNPADADDYLKGSHFSIGQDDRMNQNCLQTAYKHDYPPLPLEGRVAAIPHKASEKLLPGDQRYLGEQTMTETKAEYTEKPRVERPDIEMLKQRLGATHYKQHKDDEKAPAWTTTHKNDFMPLPLGRHELAKAVPGNNMVFGDRSKAEKPVTAYNSAFLDFSGDRAKPEMVRMAKGPPTISGDVRATTYSTTMKEHYSPVDFQHPAATIMKPCVDLFGTRGKPFEGLSEFSDKYTHHKCERSAPAAHRSYQTTFRQDDGKGVDNWSTTHKVDYVPQAPKDYDKVVKDSNKSNVPLGGKIPNDELVSNYQRNYLEWQVKPNVLANHDVDLKYKSQVVMGDPAEANKFFETTHGVTYQPFLAARPAKSDKELQKSHLPIDNWSDGAKIPTYNDDYRFFQNERSDNSEMMDRLKRSNLQFPLENDVHWRTTHKSHYTPKRMSVEKASMDRQRFQSSHISFGDSRISAFNKDCY